MEHRFTSSRAERRARRKAINDIISLGDVTKDQVKDALSGYNPDPLLLPELGNKVKTGGFTGEAALDVLQGIQDEQLAAQARKRAEAVAAKESEALKRQKKVKWQERRKQLKAAVTLSPVVLSFGFLAHKHFEENQTEQHYYELFQAHRNDSEGLTYSSNSGGLVNVEGDKKIEEMSNGGSGFIRTEAIKTEVDTKESYVKKYFEIGAPSFLGDALIEKNNGEYTATIPACERDGSHDEPNYTLKNLSQDNSNVRVKVKAVDCPVDPNDFRY